MQFWEWKRYYKIKEKFDNKEFVSDEEKINYVRTRNNIKKIESETYFDFQELKKMRNG